MSNANDLLENLTDEEIAMYTVNPETEPHIVINANRTITVPDELRNIAVQHDHNIETVTFDCPRYWDGHDMSQMAIFINYKTPDNVTGSYPIINMMIDENDESIMHFDWTISRNVTQVKGGLSFLVCAKKTDENGNEINHWNSVLNNDMKILEGIDCGPDVLDDYPDVVTRLLLGLNDKVGRAEFEDRIYELENGGGKTDLDKKVDKIDGMGLASINIGDRSDENGNHYEMLNIFTHTADGEHLYLELPMYMKGTVDEMVGKKADKPKYETVQCETYSIDLTNGFFDNRVLDITFTGMNNSSDLVFEGLKFGTMFKNLHANIIFKTSDDIIPNIIVDNPHMLSWKGDDCETGILVPQPNFIYDILIYECMGKAVAIVSKVPYSEITLM